MSAFEKAKLQLLDLPIAEQDRLYRSWRGQLISLSVDLTTTEQRRDWLYHMAHQAPDLDDLLDLMSEFNTLQSARSPEVASVIELVPHDLGFSLRTHLLPGAR